MKYTFDTIPFDILLCFLISIILIPLAILGVEGPLRIALGLPFILFIPGYLFIFTLFPHKQHDNNGIDIIERIALSFGLSLAIVPLIGLGLNYTPWGITLTSILTANSIFIFAMTLTSYFRWKQLPISKRFIITINLSLPHYENKIDQILTLILIASIIIAASTLLYVLIMPKTGEQFTEFYILGPTGLADNYPQNLNQGDQATVILGIANHEYEPINYTVEIWISDQQTFYNTTSQQNETIYNHLYYIDNLTVSLNHTDIDIEEPWQAQWETNYTFSINRTGEYKLVFLLYKNQTESYNTNTDYANIAPTKIDSENTTAYRSLHLWINVTEE
jgi:uncharacterized membrane protein